LTEQESNEGSSEIDKLLAELENETLSEDSNLNKNEAIKNKQINDKVNEIIYTLKDDEEQTDDNTW